jgi:hypothetical protein
MPEMLGVESTPRLLPAIYGLNDLGMTRSYMEAEFATRGYGFLV